MQSNEQLELSLSVIIATFADSNLNYVESST